MEKENVYLREELRAEHNFEEIVGKVQHSSKRSTLSIKSLLQIQPWSSTGKRGRGRNWWRARSTAAAPATAVPW